MTIGIIGNTAKPAGRKVIGDFVALLADNDVGYIYASELVDFLNLGPDAPIVPARSIAGSCDLVVAFGGDGTILSTADMVCDSGVPILGVNLGGLGFLAEVLVEELEMMVQKLLSNDFQVIDRMLLDVTIQKKDKNCKFTALNDIVVDKGRSSRLILIKVNVNGTFLNTYRCDGLIIATPTGSTAYSLAAGGPLLMPTMNAFVVTPICPHSLTVRPIVLTDSSVLQLSTFPGQGPVQINIDGQNIIELNDDETVEIKNAGFALKWVSMGTRDFFEILRTKLNWGIDNTVHLKGTDR